MLICAFSTPFLVILHPFLWLCSHSLSYTHLTAHTFFFSCHVFVSCILLFTCSHFLSLFFSFSFLSPSPFPLSPFFLSSYPFFSHPFSHAHAHSFYHDGMPTPCLVLLPSSQVLWPCAFSYIPMLEFVHKLFLVLSHFFCATSIFSPHTVSSLSLPFLSVFFLESSLSPPLLFLYLALWFSSCSCSLTLSFSHAITLTCFLFLSHSFLHTLPFSLPYSLSYAPSHDPTPFLATLCPFLWPCSHTFSCPCM